MKKFISVLNQHLRFTRNQPTIGALTSFALVGLISLSATAQIPLKNIAKVESGYIHSCALTTTGGVKCWGGNAGSLGDGTNVQRRTAVDVAGLTSGIEAISLGVSHSCALTETGGVKCWGSNNYGQLGNNSTERQLVPVDVSGLTSGVVAISVGNHHTCAVTNAGDVKCWGYNFQGQLGNGTTVNQTAPVTVVGLGARAISVSAGNAHTCALTELNGVKCWGKNNVGQLGDNTRNDSFIPVDVYSLSTGVAKIDLGYLHSCALLTNGHIKCWGTNYDGRLGTNSTSTSFIPVDLAGTQPPFVDLAAGVTTTCGLTILGSVKCWGANQSGQLGIGSTTGSSIPVTLAGLTTGVTALSANNLNGCAVKNNGVNCWGSNINGTVGDNTTQNRLAPTTVLQPFSPSITSVRVGDAQAVVSFTPPTDDSGYPITGYTVRPVFGEGTDVYAGTTYSHTGPHELSHLVTGLVNGNNYMFTVVATNALGTGLPSTASTTVVPMGSSASSSSQISSSSQQISSVFSSTVSSTAVNTTSSSVSVSSSSVGSSAISSSLISSSISSSSSSAVGTNNCDSVAVAFGSTHTGALELTDCRSGTRGTNYYVDRYSVSGVAGQQISIQLTSAAFDTYLVLKNDSNTVITFNDDGGGGTNSRIPASSGTYTLPTTGNFIIEVTSYSSLKVGAYTLLVNTPAPISPCSPVLPISKWVDTYGALQTSDCQTGARGAGYYTDSYFLLGRLVSELLLIIWWRLTLICF